MSGAPRTPPAAVPGRGWSWLDRLLLAAGCALFVGLVAQLGGAEVLGHLRGVGWGIVPMIAQEGLAYTSNTLGWRYAFPLPRPPIPFRRLLAGRLAGDAINVTTPTATVGGEFVRARLARHWAEPTAVYASVAIAKISQIAGQVLFVLPGTLIAMQLLPVPDAVRDGVYIAVAVFTGIIVLMVVLQRRGLFGGLLRVGARLGMPVPAGLDTRLAHLDAAIGDFYRAPWPFLASASWFALGWATGVLEVYLGLYFLDLDATWTRAVAIEAFTIAIDGMLFFVPGKVGTQEGGKVLIFTMLGLDPAKGFAFGLLRRVRELTWALIGLAVYSRLQGGRES